jgi:hypothetical protein
MATATRPGRIESASRLDGMSLKATPPPARPRKLLLSRREAAAALGMSLSHFQRHVQPSIRCVYSGQLRLYRPLELERWIEREVGRSDRGEHDGR